MTRTRQFVSHAFALGTSAAAALATQAPDATVVLLGAGLAGPTASQPSFLEGLATGADYGWAVSGRLDLGGSTQRSALFGNLTPGGVGGAQLLRIPTTIGGYTQLNLLEPSPASGRLAYIESVFPSLGSGGRSFWIDDQLIAALGDPTGSPGDAWRQFRDVIHLANGDTYVRGQFTMTQGLGVGVIRYPDRTAIVKTGDAIPGLPDAVGVVRNFRVSPNGVHWIARIGFGSPLNDAIVVDGVVHDVGGGNLAIQGGSVPDSIAGPNATFTSLTRAAINDSGDVAFSAGISSSTSGSAINIRNGRRVDATNPAASAGSLEAMGPRGFVATVEGAAFVGIDGVRATTSNSTVDIDADGTIDPGWSLRFSPFANDIVVSSDGTELYWVLQLRGPSIERPFIVARIERYGVAQAICTGRSNSTGGAAHITATGSSDVSINELTLQCIELPTASAGVFLASASAGFTPNPGGSAGDLCLAGSIGRFNQTPFLADATGRVELGIDLLAIPQPMGTVAATAGSTWYFQTWYRDTAMGQPTSNFSDAVAVQLR